MIITKGMGDRQMLVTQGYGTSSRMREVLRLTSEIPTTLEVTSKI